MAYSLSYDYESGEVSVPLRGYGFEIMTPRLHSLLTCVSVPLRGYGFEIEISSVAEAFLVAAFPSPCGDMVLKSLRRDALLCLARYAVLRRGCVLPPFHGETVF